MKEYENEIWKPIEGYEGLYEISSHCRIKSIERKVNSRYGINHTICEQILKPRVNKDGYLCVALCKNGKSSTKRIHRLFYSTFICKIPKGYDVHHKNGNVKDNRVENLELIEHKKHSTMHNRKQDKITALINRSSKQVIQYSLNGEFIAEYSSILDAQDKTGACYSSISRCCSGIQKTAGGFVWKYKN